MNVVALIGARAGSKSVHNKNIRPLNGHPLIAWSIKAAQCAGLLAIVSTDSREYAEIAHSYDAHVIMRPEKYAGDNSPDFEFIQHAIDQLNETPDYIVHLRPTTPLRDPQYIGLALDHMRNEPKATALRSVHETQESVLKYVKIEPNTGMCVPLLVNGNEALDFINDPRQVFSATYHPNGYVDVLRTDFILNSGLIHGDKVLAFITPRVTEVDAEDDFEQLQWQIEKHPDLGRRLFG